VTTNRSSSHTRALLARLLLRWLLTRDLPSHTKASLAGLRGERIAWQEFECADGLMWYNADRKTARPISLRRPKTALMAAHEGAIRQLGIALVTMSPTTRRTGGLRAQRQRLCGAGELGLRGRDGGRLRAWASS